MLKEQKIIAVCAGSYMEFKNYLVHLKVSGVLVSGPTANRYVYLVDKNTARGIRFDEVVEIGRFWYRRDADDIKQELFYSLTQDARAKYAESKGFTH